MTDRNKEVFSRLQNRITLFEEFKERISMTILNEDKFPFMLEDYKDLYDLADHMNIIFEKYISDFKKSMEKIII